MAKATNTPTSTPASTPQPSVPAVVRRYRAYGECRELGIACIAHGYIVVEQLDDGTYRLGDESQPLLEPANESAEAEDTTASTSPDAVSGQSDGAGDKPTGE